MKERSWARKEIVEYCLSCEGLDSHSERSHTAILFSSCKNRVKGGLNLNLNDI